MIGKCVALQLLRPYRMLYMSATRAVKRVNPVLVFVRIAKLTCGKNETPLDATRLIELDSVVD
jgi:hypothetical protein